MRNPGGYATWNSVDGVIEKDTFTCVHCNAVVFLEAGPGADLGGFCRKCMANICGRCADKGICRPFEKWLEQQEKAITARVEHDRAMDKILK